MRSDKTMRKCSVMLAAGMGAAVCLTSSSAKAAKISGADGNDISFLNTATEFGGKIMILNRDVHFPEEFYFWPRGSKDTRFAGSWDSICTYHEGSSCKTAIEWLRTGWPRMGGPDRFIKVRFNEGGLKYGWIQYQKVGTGDETTFVMGAWAYENNVDGAIKTLAGSIEANTLFLSDGTTKLIWSNANEDGVSRYEAQMKNASGAWTTVSSDAAGAGSYSATVPAGSTCRIVVEKVDGAVEEIGF